MFRRIRSVQHATDTVTYTQTWDFIWPFPQSVPSIYSVHAKENQFERFCFSAKELEFPPPTHTPRHTHTAGALITFYFQILPGNINTYSEVENVLQPSIFASKVRIYPYSQYDRTVCLRAEIVGCAWEGEFPPSLLQLLAMNYS